MPRLLAHESQGAQIFGRYSAPFGSFLIIWTAVLLLAAMGLLLPEAIWEGGRAKLARSRVGRGLVRWWWLPLLVSTVVLLAASRLGGIFEFGRTSGLQSSLLLLWLSWNLVILDVVASPQAWAGIGRGLLGLVGVVAALVLIEVLLRAMPALVPTAVRLALPGGGRYLTAASYQREVPIRVGYRFAPMIDSWFRFDPDDSGLDGIDGTVGPSGTADAEPLQLHFVTDENGFLNTPPVEGRVFPIVMAGDSFLTLTASVHWPELLSEQTGMDVLNLSMPGWGTQAEVEAVEAYGLDKSPEWVVIAYFEGNDLWDARRYQDKQAAGRDWIEDDVASAGLWQTLVVPHLLSYGLHQIRTLLLPPETTYPMDIRVGDATLTVAFLDRYVGALTACRDTLAPSRNLDAVKTALLRARQSVTKAGARLVLVYVPSEEHVYLPLIEDVGQLQAIYRGAPSVLLDQDGYLTFTPNPPAWPDGSRCMDDQQGLLLDYTESAQIDFVDLTRCFRESAATGVELYNYADTHWNDAGQALAAELVASHLTGDAPRCLTERAGVASP